MYFQFYSFSVETAFDIACLMHKEPYKFSDVHKASQMFRMKEAHEHIERELKVTWETGSFGRYLARGHTDLVEVRKASDFENLTEEDVSLQLSFRTFHAI